VATQTTTHKDFTNWGATVPKWSRWWIDDDLFEEIAQVLAMDAGPVHCDSLRLPVFSMQWKGLVTIYRKSQYGVTRKP
jgi:hypothetical protein